MSRSRPPPRKLRRLLLTGLLLGLAGLCVALSLYVLYLDNDIRQRFAGVRWALPAQIFAAPLELHVGAPLERAVLVAELQRLGYREGRLDRPGRYALRGGDLSLHTRAFEFWDGPQAAQRLRLQFSGGRVSALAALDGEAPPVVRLDPLLIGSIYPQHGEDRLLLRLADAPQLLVHGLIAVEDRRFHEHHGLDPKAIARAAFANLRSGGVVQGGSTLTQQLIKNFFLDNERTLRRKLSEALYALLLEWHYDKPAILEAYLNEIYLGQDGARAVHGFGLASQHYFRKPLGELESQELALLVAIVKGPSWYDPRRHPERARQRRDEVLRIWRDEGLLDSAAESRARMQDLGVAKTQASGRMRFPAFIELVRQELESSYHERDLTHEGLRIFTTLEPWRQAAAESAIGDGLARLERERGLEALQGAAIISSVTDGSVLALVGGRDAGAGFNRALHARRPVGSLLKPAVYLAALRDPDRYQLISPIQDEAVHYRQANGEIWEPQNYDLKTHGEIPLYRGLVHSYNLATVNLALDVGLQRIVHTVQDLGLRRPLQPLPSLALGAVEMAPLDVARIYGTLAAGGFPTPLRAIREVLTRESVPLQRFPFELGKVLSPQAVFLLNWALEQVMQQGTGRGGYRILDPELRLAGKTGTTDELRDSWYAGFGGNLLGVVWVGRDDNRPAGLTGASGALPLWAEMLAAAGVSSRVASEPDGIEWARVDIQSHLPAERGCRSILRVPFVRGSVPREQAPCARRRGLRQMFQDFIN